MNLGNREAMVQTVGYNISEFVNSKPGKSTRDLGDHFLDWIEANLLPQPSEDFYVRCDGPGDDGIDLAMYAANELFIIQAKYQNAHTIDAALAFHTIAQNIKSYMNGASGAKIPLQLVDLFTKISEEVGELSDIPFHAHYIANTHFTESERRRFRDINPPPYLQFLDLGGITEEIHSVNDSSSTAEGELSYQGQFLKTNDGKVYICVVPLTSVARFARNAGNKLFDANVRYYLKRTSVNKDIHTTLCSEPEKFMFYNNGITIVCNSVREMPGKFFLSGAQVVNGCQTINEIVLAAREHTREKGEFSGYVLVRIIETPAHDEGLKQKITQRTNKQNAIRTKDFLSMAKSQRDLHGGFKRIGYYYEFRRGQSSMLKANDKKIYTGITELHYLESPKWKFRKITAFDAQQCFMAAYLDKPGAAKNTLGQINPLDNDYDKLFEGLETDNPLDYLIPYLVGQYADFYDYGQPNMGWKSHARLNFVSFVFRVAEATLRETFGGMPEVKQRDPKVLGPHFDRLFRSEEVGLGILDAAHDALTSFNMIVEERTGHDARNYYRRDFHIHNPEEDERIWRTINKTLTEKRSHRQWIRAAHDLLLPAKSQS